MFSTLTDLFDADIRVLAATNILLVVANVAFLLRLAYRPSRCFDQVLKMLSDEQGDWYIEKVLGQELAKVLRHNTRDDEDDDDDLDDADSLEDGDSDDDEEDFGSGTDESDDDDDDDLSDDYDSDDFDDSEAIRAVYGRRVRFSTKKRSPTAAKDAEFFAAGAPPPPPSADATHKGLRRRRGRGSRAANVGGSDAPGRDKAADAGKAGDQTGSPPAKPAATTNAATQSWADMMEAEDARTAAASSRSDKQKKDGGAP